LVTDPSPLAISGLARPNPHESLLTVGMPRVNVKEISVQVYWALLVQCLNLVMAA
jgi:hypothetical protein